MLFIYAERRKYDVLTKSIAISKNGGYIGYGFIETLTYVWDVIRQEEKHNLRNICDKLLRMKSPYKQTEYFAFEYKEDDKLVRLYDMFWKTIDSTITIGATIGKHMAKFWRKFHAKSEITIEELPAETTPIAASVIATAPPLSVIDVHAIEMEELPLDESSLPVIKLEPQVKEVVLPSVETVLHLDLPKKAVVGNVVFCGRNIPENGEYSVDEDLDLSGADVQIVPQLIEVEDKVKVMIEGRPIAPILNMLVAKSRSVEIIVPQHIDQTDFRRVECNAMNIINLKGDTNNPNRFLYNYNPHTATVTYKKPRVPTNYYNNYGYNLEKYAYKSMYGIMPYAKGKLNNVVWGQVKLFAAEVCFLIHLKGQISDVLYVGAAPGEHISVLAQMFPGLIFHLYDPRKFSEKLKMGNVRLYNKLFTLEEARQWSSMARFAFVCDIRSEINPTKQTSEQIDQIVSEDMQLQSSLFTTMKKPPSMLKMRAPYLKDTFDYWDGLRLMPYYGPDSTNEVRLVTGKEDKLRTYNARVLDDECYSFNRYVRTMEHEWQGEKKRVDEIFLLDGIKTYETEFPGGLKKDKILSLIKQVSEVRSLSKPVADNKKIVKVDDWEEAESQPFLTCHVTHQQFKTVGVRDLPDPKDWKVTKLKFSTTEVKANFDSYLNATRVNSWTLDNPYQELHEELVKTMEKHVPRAIEKDVVIVNAVAGGGKTTWLVNNVGPQDVYIVGSSEMMNSFRADYYKKWAKYPITKTFEKALNDPKLMQYKRIFIDECFVLGKSWYLCLMMMSSGKITMVGDKHQTTYHDVDQALIPGQDSRDFINEATINVGTKTYRFGAKTCAFLRRTFGYEIYGRYSKKEKFTYSRRPVRIDDSHCIALSKRTTKFVKENFGTCSTVKSYQGKDNQIINYCVSFSLDGRGLRGMRDMQIVALSRHKDWINIVELEPGSIESMPYAQNIFALFEAYTDQPIAPSTVMKKTYTVENIDHTEANMFEVTNKFDPQILAQAAFVEPNNSNLQEASTILDVTVNKEVTVYFDKLLEHKPVETISLSKFHTGKVFQRQDKKSFMATVVQRAIDWCKEKKVKPKFVSPHKKNEFFNFMFRDNYHQYTNMVISGLERELSDHITGNTTVSPVDNDINSHYYNNIMEIVRTQKAKKALNLIEQIYDMTKDFVAREHNKAQEKPKNWFAAYETKEGQPIKALGKTITAVYNIIFRALRDWTKEFLPPNVVIDEGWTEEQTLNVLTNLENNYNPTARMGIDQPRFDSIQNEATQDAEIYFIEEMMQLPREKAMDLYYMIRADIKVYNDISSYYNGTKRPSGGPDTLFGNSIVNLVYLFQVTTVDNISYIIVKGDDSVLAVYRYVTTFPILGLFPLKAKILYFDDVIEFCGLLYDKYSGVYSVLRLAFKVLTRNYKPIIDRGNKMEILKDIAQYQLAVADKLVLTRNKGAMGYDARYHGLETETIRTMVEELTSFTKAEPEDIYKMLISDAAIDLEMTHDTDFTYKMSDK